MNNSAQPHAVSTDSTVAPDGLRAIIKPEDIASTERALKQLASVTQDPQAADSLLQLASAIRPVSHWGLNE